MSKISREILTHQFKHTTHIFICFWWGFFFSFFLRAALIPYGSSQARGQIWAGLHHSHINVDLIQSATYTTTHSNAKSLIHWARPGIIPKSLWILVGFITSWARVGTSGDIFINIHWLWICPIRMAKCNDKLWSSKFLDLKIYFWRK